MTELFNQIADSLSTAKTVAIAVHVNPDGDTLGSALALAIALEHLGKSVTVLSHDNTPEILKWLPGASMVNRKLDVESVDIGLVCDTSGMDRIGRSREVIEAARIRITIDHHVMLDQQPGIHLCDTTAAATGELIYELLLTMKVNLTPEIATNLLCALITDTGSFRFMNVTPNTLRIAANLMEAGGNPADISELVFEQRSFASIKLLGRALSNIQSDAAGEVCWSSLSADDYDEFEATDEDTEGIVSHIRSIRSARIGILLREIRGKKIRISLRSRDGFDANVLARKFGGGGHKLASGCSHDGPLDDATTALVNAAIEQLSVIENSN